MIGFHDPVSGEMFKETMRMCKDHAVAVRAVNDVLDVLAAISASEYADEVKKQALQKPKE